MTVIQTLAAFALDPPERPATAGDLLAGLLAVCRTSILHGADHLVGKAPHHLSGGERRRAW